MLQKGYTPTRWSTYGVEISLTGDSWLCNGLGCYIKPEDAVAHAPLVSSEVWRSIQVEERLYNVSSMGRIRDSRNNELTVYVDQKRGYQYVFLKVAKKKKKKSVHRLVAQAFCFENASGISEPSVHHINGNRYDNRAANLVIMSRKEHIKLHRDDNKNCCPVGPINWIPTLPLSAEA
ncbi:MAG: NUMOD4 motif-containing HNH endonuclease, partial [Coriobacteriales bacterium]|nr:NUMOD4 motif-containing HNH endonuclease [Coriobacteriales bacterium]